MVKAELNYNPYLMETNIKFNGQVPRINSLVEKYQQETLQNWIKKIPSIFYDEMNGYDFELEFSGTRLEFEDLVKTFAEAGVSEDLVRLFHKNELDSRKAKTDKIEELLSWFRNNPNRKFDFELFMEENRELFDGDYVCVMLNGKSGVQELFTENKVSVETIETVDELNNTELFHTPIVLWIDNSTLPEMKSNLRYFLTRKDVSQNQLFFVIQPPLSETSLERTIKDLGIEQPQLIINLEDAKVKRYLETYQISDYIYDVITLLRKEESKIVEVLNDENEKSMISNKEIHMQIDGLEDVIKRLKDSLIRFVNRDNMDVLSEMQNTREHFFNMIQNWKSKKTKITRENEAAYFAQDFEQQVQKQYVEFCKKIENIFLNTQSAIEAEYKMWYEDAKYEEDYVPAVSSIKNTSYKVMPAFSGELLKMKDEKYVMPKEDLFGKFFKSSNDKELTPVLEITYYCQQWRDYVVSLVEPFVSELIHENEMILKAYATELAELYKTQLEELIKERTDVKENVSAQLSDDELKLQLDNDWLVSFQDQLRVIERG